MHRGHLVRQRRYAGLDVDTAADGIDGFDEARSGRYDVVVLERDLDGLSGDEICWRLCSTRQPARVLMLSPCAAIEERVSGLEIGADDYLTKPFAEIEFVARVRALGRRQVRAAGMMLRCGDVELDPDSRRVHRDGVPIHLANNQEFRLLETLLRANGGLVSTRELLDQIWGQRADAPSTTVRVTMRTLRTKLGQPPS